MGWKDDKNLGPWEFNPKENKPSYNEGDHIATYANPVWSMVEGSNIPITPTHNPCGYWTKNYVAPFIIPPPWAWFKHDEGSGGIIIDYSPFAINGYISGTGGATPEQLQTIFWDTPGFGHSQGQGYPRVQTSRIALPRSLNYTSGIFFVRPLDYVQEANPNRACMVGEGGDINWSVWGWTNTTPTYWAMAASNLEPVTAISSILVDFNNWHCVYFVGAPYSGYEYQMWIRKSGESFTQIINAVHTYNFKDEGHAIYNFGPTNQGCSMDGGDFLIYADATPTGIITLDQANGIYGLLKSRYGMT